jgi:hypothetical protein
MLVPTFRLVDGGGTERLLVLLRTTDGRGNSLVALSRVYDANIFGTPGKTVNPHYKYAIKPLCIASLKMYRHVPFVAYHYLRTLEHWSYRKDAIPTVRFNRAEYAIFQQLSEVKIRVCAPS